MKVGVIMGGVSSEREVSLMTGKEIVGKLDSNKYEVIPIELTKREELIDRVRGIDFALLALHGVFGEDGTVQGVLETMGIPYSGSGVLSSSLCMDKNLTKRLLQTEGIATPDGAYLDRRMFADGTWESKAAGLTYPLFVKPNAGGSSIGVQRVDRPELLGSALEEAFRWGESVLVESMVSGQEITCPILDGELLPVLGIRAANGAEWFDYEAKYSDGGAEEKPITLPPDVAARVREAALACYRLLQCRVYARVDMILKDGVPYVLEVNTLPGMTANSLLPRSAAAAGIPYSELLDRIIELSLAERGESSFTPQHSAHIK
ncbi:D-alanine--D-alanine ligase [Paenibacillus barengoltzii]|uniref:D-alanine--D-alanine ligase n=1 Tax=Paenibacillus barengoltzii TaxID=343517 RepID=UPI000FD8B728|nr:D-alanine--D-alanine ligase [Paenibacillus barengoltzii]